jgi:hypothetical protein
VIQTVLAAQLVSRGLIDPGSSDNGTAPSAAEARLPSTLIAPPVAKR